MFFLTRRISGRRREQYSSEHWLYHHVVLRNYFRILQHRREHRLQGNLISVINLSHLMPFPGYGGHGGDQRTPRRGMGQDAQKLKSPRFSHAIDRLHGQIRA